MKAPSLARANGKLRLLVADVHARVDAHHAKPTQQHPGVRCTEGCAFAPDGCCGILTLVELAEAEYIVARNAEAVEQALPRLLEAERRIGENLSSHSIAAMFADPAAEPAVTEAYHRAHIVCPFLGDDRRCTIYRDRPVACRTHFVLSEPAECVHAGPNKKHWILDKGTRIGAQDMIVRGVAQLRRGNLMFGTLPQLVLRAWRNAKGGRHGMDRDRTATDARAAHPGRQHELLRSEHRRAEPDAGDA